MSKELTRAQKGALGELLVQIDLLRCGLDSARLTTDSGVDLVAFNKKVRKTVQVKTRTLRQKGQVFSCTVKGNKVKTAELYAFVEVDDNGIQATTWYLTRQDFCRETMGPGKKSDGPRKLRIRSIGSTKKTRGRKDFKKYEGSHGLNRALRAK